MRRVVGTLEHRTPQIDDPFVVNAEGNRMTF